MIQALFFDFNGVVIHDEPLHMKAYQEVLAGEGIELSDAEYLTMLGMDDKTFVRTAFERAGKPLADDLARDVITREWAAHRKMIEGELPLAPGAVTFIKAAARHFELGVVSMASRGGIDYVLGRANLDGAFKVIVSAEDVDACKPDPRCYQRALELLNQQRRDARKLPLVPGECLVIEDSRFAARHPVGSRRRDAHSGRNQHGRRSGPARGGRGRRHAQPRRLDCGRRASRVLRGMRDEG
jgi:beta-phosphoglucomutase